MAVLSVVLLLVGIGGAVLRPFGLPAWVVPVVAALVDVAAGAAGLHATSEALRTLAQPIGFLLAAVPLSMLLDRLGFFAALARVLTRGPHATVGLWLLAALVTTVLNLDAAVVLLTPLYVRIARRRGLDPLSLAAQPLVLTWLASSALPVSNLTNLIAVSATGASSEAFLGHLALPSAVAVAVGWLCYRRLAARGLRGPGHLRPIGAAVVAAGVGPAGESETRLGPDERRGLLVGGVIVAAVLAGFVFGRDAGIEEWEVAAGADLVLVALVRTVPWRTLPAGTALIAASLAALAAAAVVHVHVASLVGSATVMGLARTAALSALLANVLNNLPALLVLLPAVGHHATPQLWAVLIGVNMGPGLVVTGTLASLLWLDTLGRLDVAVGARDVSRLGLWIGMPAGAAGLVALLGAHAAGLAR